MGSLLARKQMLCVVAVGSHNESQSRLCLIAFVAVKQASVHVAFV